MDGAIYWTAVIVAGVAIGIVLVNAIMAFLAVYPIRPVVAFWLGLAVVCYAAVYVAFVAGWMTTGVQWLGKL